MNRRQLFAGILGLPGAAATRAAEGFRDFEYHAVLIGTATPEVHQRVMTSLQRGTFIIVPVYDQRLDALDALWAGR